MVILDVREPEESMPNVPKDETIVAYCRSGNRSGAAQYILRKAGFTNVTNGGGLGDMLRAGYEPE